MYNRTWTEASVPSEWRIAHVVPILKKKGSSKVSSSIPVSLLLVVSKVMVIIIINRLKEWYQPNNIVPEEQSEFQPRSSFLAVSPLFLGLAGRPLLFCFAATSLPREVRSTTPDARKRNSCHLVCYGS